MSLPTMIVVSVDDGNDAFKQMVDEINAQLAERGCIGNLDAMEMSFDCCVMDAAMILKAEVEYVGRDYILVAMQGAPLDLARAQMEAVPA